jgi:hypothetical protein
VSSTTLRLASPRSLRLAVLRLAVALTSLGSILGPAVPLAILGTKGLGIGSATCLALFDVAAVAIAVRCQPLASKLAVLAAQLATVAP